MTKNEELRRFGNDLVGLIPWGAHLCQFYETKQDLIDILVPYFAEGLRSNEFCMWVTSKPLEVREATEALREAVSNLDEYISRKQIEIISYDDWYMLDGKFDSDRVLQGWVEKENDALKRGFEGLRLTGNTFWIERELWNSFVDYEEAVNSVIGKHRMIALCTYCLKSCSGTDVVDVVRNHVGTLIKQVNEWYLIEDATRRQVANGALKLSNQKYSALFENMQDGFAYHKMLFDERGKPVDYVFLEVNDAFERLTGLKREDVIGKRVTQVLPGVEKDPADWIGVYGKVALTGESVRFENYSQHLNRWYLVSAYSPEKNYFVATFEDVTERKLAEEEIKHLNAFQRRVFESIKDELMVIDLRNFTVLMANNILLKNVGMEEKEVIGRQCFAVTHHNSERCSTPAHTCPVTEMLRTGKSITVEHTHFDSKGNPIYVEVSASPITDQEGNIVQAVHLARDITERKKAEEMLHESQRDLIHAQSMGKIGSWRLDIQRNVLQWSDELFSMFGVAKGTPLTYETFLSIVHPDDREYVDQQWKAGLQGEPYDIEHRIIVDDQVKWVRERAELELDRDGMLLGGFGTAQDITDFVAMREKIRDYSKHLESYSKELEDTQKRLEEKAAEVEEYATRMEELAEKRAEKLRDAERLAAIGATAGMVGHDIRNPLQSIDGSLFLAKQSIFSSSAKNGEKRELIKELDLINEQIVYINRMVADLQDFAKKATPQFEETDIRKSITDSLSLISIPGNIKVNVIFSEEPLTLALDRTHIKRVFVNLIRNAIQAMPDGGTLTIIGSRKDSDVWIHFEDTGVGIAEEVKPNIFTPLFTTKSKGQGFGLAVCKKLVESNGGEITFESEEENGTVFMIRLPAGSNNRGDR